jgi:hypothetical protein
VILVITAALVTAGAAAVYAPGSPLAEYAPNRLFGRDRADGAQPPPQVSEGTSVTQQPAPSTPPPAPVGPLLTPHPVTISTPGFWSWALLDTKAGTLVGSPNINAQTDTASMIKAWIAADYLRRAAERKQTPNAETMSRLSRMIRDSENEYAFDFHVANGNLSSIKRLIQMCGLSDTTGIQNSWSLTRVSARDAARLAACISDGRAAGPKWTPWLLGEMRAVRGPGRFGVIEVAPPAERVATKNGWLLREDGQWHISCMAVGDGWSLGVMVRYTGRLGRDHGTGICRKVAEQLMSTSG